MLQRSILWVHCDQISLGVHYGIAPSRVQNLTDEYLQSHRDNLNRDGLT